MPAIKNPAATIECKVLCKNQRLLFGDLIDLPKGQSIEFDLKSTVDLLNKGDFPKLYKTAIDDITQSFSIPACHKESLESVLTQTSVLYLIFVMLTHSRSAYDDILRQLSAITKAVKKLRHLLTAAGDDIADFLSLLETADFQAGGYLPRRQFHKDLLESLDHLIETPSLIPKTPAGKAFKIGSEGRKPNAALYGWISHLLQFWQNDLGRSLQRDNAKISGRKQFIEFIDLCMEPLHPAMMLHSSDALDTMLKTIQADNKRGENRAIF